MEFLFELFTSYKIFLFFKLKSYIVICLIVDKKMGFFSIFNYKVFKSWRRKGV